MSLETSIDQYAKEDWWTFDTNGLSELIKLCLAGEQAKVNRFLEGQFVLITLPNMVELYRASYLLEQLPGVFEAAAYTGVTTQTLAFFRRDLLKALGLGPSGFDPNPLGLLELTLEFAVGLPEYEPFKQAVRESDERIEQEFCLKVEKDIGAGIHPADVYMHAQWAIGNHIDAILGKGMSDSLPRAAVPRTPEGFPSRYCYDFTYYFLYCTDANVKCYVNDFNDLELTLAAPICQRFYTERRLAYALRQVKNYSLPSERQVRDRFHKVTEPERTRSERRRLIKGLSSTCPRLLQTTDVFSLTDLRHHLET